MNLFELPTPVEELQSFFLTEHGLKLFVKRDDLIHPEISGNKWRKLKYNLEAAKREGHHSILTFGGAFSNHLLATAVAGKQMGLKIIAVVRGERAEFLSDTLKDCEENEMQLHFVSRSAYKIKREPGFLNKLEAQFGRFFLVPEGGANERGIKGCEEIITEVNSDFDFVACSAGTGTTAAGILRSLDQGKLLVFPALKGINFIEEDSFKSIKGTEKENQVQFFNDYHLGGYAKVNDELIDFVRSIYKNYQLKLDLIYTAKLFYGIFDLIKKGHFQADSKILLIHTGGLQGNRGMERKHNMQLFC